MFGSSNNPFGHCKSCGKLRNLKPGRKIPTCFRCAKSIRATIAPNLPAIGESRRRSKPVKSESAARMRREPTPAEARLWDGIRASQLGIKFRRQVVIRGWILDVYCPLLGLAVEADGGYHTSRTAEDRTRDTVLGSFGITTLRFTNDQILRDWPTVRARIVSEAYRIRSLANSACKYSVNG